MRFIGFSRFIKDDQQVLKTYRHDIECPCFADVVDLKIKHHAHSNKRDTKDRLGLFSKDTQFLCPRPRIRVETPRQNKL